MIYKIIVAALIVFNTATPHIQNKDNDLNAYEKIWKKTGLFKSIGFFIPQTEERTAIHESGHIVSGKFLDINITKASIKKNPELDSLGETYYITNNESAKIKLLLAGFLTELALLNKASNRCDNDLNIATKKIIELHHLDKNNNSATTNKITKYLEETAVIINDNLEIIARFKEELLVKKELNKKEIDEIYSEEKLKKTVI